AGGRGGGGGGAGISGGASTVSIGTTGGSVSSSAGDGTSGAGATGASTPPTSNLASLASNAATVFSSRSSRVSVVCGAGFTTVVCVGVAACFLEPMMIPASQPMNASTTAPLQPHPRPPTIAPRISPSHAMLFSLSPLAAHLRDPLLQRIARRLRGCDGRPRLERDRREQSSPERLRHRLAAAPAEEASPKPLQR